MNYIPALHFTQHIETDLKKMADDDLSRLNTTIQVLGTYEEIFRDNYFEFERDVFHETRCALIKIRDYKKLEKIEDYVITRKDNLKSEDDN